MLLRVGYKMDKLYSKRSIRTVTVLTGAIVLALSLARLVYPSINGDLGELSGIVTALYLAYMGIHVGHDWGVEYRQSK
jgi:hypothetical protein